MNGAAYLGIDIGTSAVKALLVDGNQRVLADAERPVTTHRPAPGWSEQNPEDWWAALLAVAADIRGHAPKAFAAVDGIGLSGQMHGAVLLDGRDRILRPAILWNDGRAEAECAVLAERVPDLAQRAGVIAMPGFTAPKLLWVAHHEPEVFTRIRRVMLPKDYVRLRLTGEFLTDMSDAAGSLWLDEAERDWSTPIVAASGLELGQLPGLVEGSAPGGRLRKDIAEDLGLKAGIVVAGGGDSAVGAVGIGAIDDGDGFISLGTSGQYFVTCDAYRPKPETLLHTYCMPLPGRWYQMAAMLNSASALGWAARLVHEPDIGALIDRVEAAYEGPGDILFLPYLTGERTPHNDPHARGVFSNLRAGHGTLDLIQAVLEGVAFIYADSQDAMLSAGTSVDRLAAIGGGARSRFWMRILASVLGRPIHLYAHGERGHAFGAARLARLAATGEAPAIVCAKPAIDHIIEPDPTLHDAYQHSIQRFRRLYRILKEEFSVPPNGHPE